MEEEDSESTQLTVLKFFGFIRMIHRSKQAQLHDMQFGEVSDEPLPPELENYAFTLYSRVRAAYEAAEEPLGPSDEAMLVWFTFEEGLVDHLSVPTDT